MIAFAYYLLKVTACSGLLFLYYHLLLRNKVFHQWNRFYLLAALLLSITLPLLQFTIEHHPDEATGAIQMLQVVQSADLFVAEMDQGRSAGVTAEQWMAFAYALVSFVLLCG